MFHPFHNSKAFSLVEMLVVISIFAFVFLFTAKNFSSRKNKINTNFNKLIYLNRSLTIKSKLHNSIYRLVISLSPEGPEEYWVEKKQKNPENTKSPSNNAENSDDYVFFLDDSFYSDPQTLSPFLNISQITSPTWEKKKTEGLVYIYYYPKGLAQETSIEFSRTDREGNWTLRLDPVTKNLKIIK